MTWTSIPGTAQPANPPAAEATPPRTYRSVPGTENLPPSNSIFSSTNNPRPVDMGGDPVIGVLRSATRGVLGEGVPALVNAPSATINLAGKADKFIDPYMPEMLKTKNIDKAIDTYLPSWLSFLKSSEEMPDLYTPTKNAMAKLTMGESEYEPKNLVEKGVARVGSFIPAAAAAVLTGGATLPEALIYGAAAPAVAGMVAEPAGTALATKLQLENPEAYGTGARIAAEMLAPAGVSRVGRIGAKPLPGASDRLNDLTELNNLGIETTAAPFHPAGIQREAAYAREAANPRLAAIHGKQDEMFTRHMLDNVGIDGTTSAKYGYGDVLTPDNMKKTFSEELDAVGKGIGSIYENANIQPTLNDISRLRQIRTDFGLPPPIYGNMFGKDLHLIRQDLNDIISGARPVSRQLVDDANKARDELDAMFARSAGADTADALKAANDRFARMKIIEQSFGDSGLVDPKRMVATISSATGNPGSMLKVSELAKNYLIQNGIRPTADAMQKVIGWLVTGGGGLLSGGISSIGMGFGLKPALIGAGTAGLSLLGRAAYNAAKNSKLGTQLGQNISRRQGIYGDVPIAPITAPAAITETGNYIERLAPYKRGGRVSSHEHAADQLVKAAERAKKGWSAKTEPLLNQSDDAVAYALEVANRSI